MQSYQTYRWLQPAQGQTRVDNELIDSRIESAVNATLQGKGLRLVTSGDADFGVGFQAARDERTEYRTTSNYYGYRTGRRGGVGGGGMSTSSTSEERIPMGSLVIAIVDGATNELVWQGTGQADLETDVSAEERTRNINETVGKVLEGFPPSS